MSARVAVVGDALLDVHVRHVADIRQGSDIPAEVSAGVGGQGANLAVRLARRGADVELVCGLGTDAAAELVRVALRAEGVRLRELTVDRTGAVVVLGDAAGERSMLSQRAPFGGVAPGALPQDAEWLVMSGYLLVEPVAGEIARAAAAASSRRMLVGCAVPDDALDGWRAAARALRPDLLVLNRDELDRLGTDVGAGALAVTDSTGAVASVGGLSVRAPTPPGPAALDTTGAGDAFAATLLACLAGERWPPGAAALQAAVTRAVDVAAAVARAPGAQARVEGERR